MLVKLLKLLQPQFPHVLPVQDAGGGGGDLDSPEMPPHHCHPMSDSTVSQVWSPLRAGEHGGHNMASGWEDGQSERVEGRERGKGHPGVGDREPTPFLL